MNKIERNLTETAANEPPVDSEWWRGAVIYQVYPRSFQDTSGDGIGDIAGITRRLEHIASLGVDAIWISPFFTSPMLDFGYDITDYRSVDPMFGSLADFIELVEAAHARGIRIMIDLVISHTSDQHPWFSESRSNRDNAKQDWYVWADAKPDGSPPNNWLSVFGGSAWQWDTRRCQYYLHNFLDTQPDLNFHCAEVQDALLDIVRFWLDLGVDGFRLDTINFYFHDQELRDNPALAVEHRNASIAPAVNPYNYQDHLYDKNRPENLDFLRRFRAVMDEYPAIAAVGEVGDAQYGLGIVADYTSGNDKIHMCYAFDFLSPQHLTVDRVSRVLTDFDRSAPDGWACWAFSNHDVMRHATRWASGDGRDERYLKLLAGLLLSLRGSACIYQGEELGLTEADLAFEDLRDPYGIRFWPDYKGRDGCRTPMIWTGQEPNAGFTDGRPWLPIPSEHLHYAVDQQDFLHGSVLNHYRHFIDFRKRNRALVKGDLELSNDAGSVLSFVRRYEGESIFCAFNLSSLEQSLPLPDVTLTVLHGHGFSGRVDDGSIWLAPYDACFARME